MKANEYKVLSEAVEEGVSYGYQRAFKYSDDPTPDAIQAAIVDAVMLQICEYFFFEDLNNANT